jgi:ubiquinone/menaquinone biosynthesis C-methylase UbiE
MFSKNGPTFFELVRQALCSTQGGYDLLGPKFDATPFRTPDALIEPVIGAIGEVDAALDLCCGTGAGMQFLRPVCRERVVGIDFSRGMLEQAKRNVEKARGRAKVEFVEGNVLQMNFKEAFDVATCFGALGHILPAEEPAFLRGVHKALRPGGRFVFISSYRPSLLSLSTLWRRAFNATMKVRNAVVRPPFIMYYFTFLLPEIAQKLAGEGFTTGVRALPGQKYHLVIATKS